MGNDNFIFILIILFCELLQRFIVGPVISFPRLLSMINERGQIPWDISYMMYKVCFVFRLDVSLFLRNPYLKNNQQIYYWCFRGHKRGSTPSANRGVYGRMLRYLYRKEEKVCYFWSLFIFIFANHKSFLSLCGMKINNLFFKIDIVRDC